jgi:Zn finger protein HypA/HybF involved in hydrogenase expression
MERWWCMDCLAPVELDKHGRCASCDSEAVDLMDRRFQLRKPEPCALVEATGALSCA